MSSDTTLGALLPWRSGCQFREGRGRGRAYPEELLDAAAYVDGEHAPALGLYPQCSGGDRDLVRSVKVVLCASVCGPARRGWRGSLRR